MTWQRKVLRLKNFDYSSDATYFITICTHQRLFLFGDIISGKMALNDGGTMAEACWREIPVHYPNVTLDTFVIMPNHVHGIIVITNNVRANNYSPLQEKSGGTTRTIGAIVRGYKIGVTKWMRNYSNTNHVWQRGYYERIIRNENELHETRKYIQENPLKWATDPENIDHGESRL